MSEKTNKDPLLDTKEAADYIDLKNHNTLTVWRSTKQQKIDYIKVGRSVRYPKSALDKYLKDRLVR